MTKPRLLIVEDHRQLAENLFEFLGEQQFDLDHAYDGLTALHLLATQQYDLIILDINLPGVDGLTVCRRLRDDMSSPVPVLLLTARDSIDDKVAGLEAGADDYLIKPFSLRELSARIKALLRRANAGPGDSVSAGPLTFYPGTLKLSSSDGRELSLTGHAATIMEKLMRSYPNYASHEEISSSLWGTPDGDPNTIRTHVYGLRQSLRATFGKEYVRTLHGRGYQLDFADALQEQAK